MDYNFELVHISGKKNGWADALSRWPDYKMGKEDNKQLVVLPPKFFERACHSPDPYPDYLGFSYNADYPSYFFED